MADMGQGGQLAVNKMKDGVKRRFRGEMNLVADMPRAGGSSVGTTKCLCVYANDISRVYAACISIHFII